ncbi:hypothetical protein OH77DRAFT_356255 [Trametes cingulata]|nr:hypothetical protein OH77DRAFT_356255 [Trametes cingulata]
MPPRTTKNRLPSTVKGLRATLSASEPFCSGTLQLHPKDLEIYYGREAGRFVDLAQVAQQLDVLEELEKACEHAPFGREETTMDETYRKAGRMDAGNFVTRFDVRESGLLNVIRAGLLTGEREIDSIRAELYELNVYGKGALSKPHTDTPRGEDMFASLVVILPTPHEGGQLVLRNKRKKWTFDAGPLLAGVNDRIAYIAFCSDVEHEVLPVLSGHRVTLTYGLYLAKDPHSAWPGGLTIIHPSNSNPNIVKDALVALLNDPGVLPGGGTLGFGLRHLYSRPNGVGALGTAGRSADHCEAVAERQRCRPLLCASGSWARAAVPYARGRRGTHSGQPHGQPVGQAA